MANTLFLRLEGPLQSWGERGQWGVRDSAPEPTKSAVIGLLGCALGWNDDARLRDLSDRLKMAVRCDRPGIRLTDYHTVGGGYHQPQLLQANLKPKGKPGNAHTELTWRDYLCDASFLVVLQGADDLIEQLGLAVREPVWPVFLGRKSCVPSRPVYEDTGNFGTLADALQRPWRNDLAAAESSLRVRALVETTRSEGVRRPHRFEARNRRPHQAIYVADRVLEIRCLPGEADHEERVT